MYKNYLLLIDMEHDHTSIKCVGWYDTEEEIKEKIEWCKKLCYSFEAYNLKVNKVYQPHSQNDPEPFKLI